MTEKMPAEWGAALMASIHTPGPVRVQLRRTKGWRMPENTVKVDRSTPWGNPYRAGVHCDHQHAVDCHRFLLTQRQPAKTAPWSDSDVLIYRDDALRNLDSIRGKNLACWCPLDQPCHADILLELANQPLIHTPERRER